jgi:hypothetical protein
MEEVEYRKMVRNKKARRLQKQTVMKYTEALREVEKNLQANKKENK